MLPLVAPALVLYLLANLAASTPALDPAGWALAACAALLSLVPAVAQRQDARPGARRIAWMAFALAIALVGRAQHALSLTLELAARAPLPWAAALAADLAFDVPDQPPRLARFARLRAFLFGLAGVTSSIGAASVLGPLPGGLLVGEGLGSLVPIVSLALLAIALLLRVLRRRLGSEPEALAASAGAGTGTFAALVVSLLAVALVLGGETSADGQPIRGLFAAAAMCLVVGHLSIRGELRPVGAAEATRRVVSGFLLVGIVGVVVAQLAPVLPDDRTALGVIAAGLAVVAAGLGMVLREVVERIVAPDAGRLLSALALADRASAGARDLDTLGAAILGPLRKASRRADAEPLLFSVDPPRAVRIDAAGLAHVEPRSLSPALLERLTARPGEIVLRGPIEVLVVRRPDLRALAESLETLDAIAVVPLVHQGELEGAIVVPRGARRSALTLEELAALERLAARVTPVVGLLGTQARGQGREADLMTQREQLEEKLDVIEDELARSRAEATRVKEGVGGPSAAPLVAYGPAMRRTLARIEEIASLDAPVLLAFEPGVAAAPLVRKLHEQSPRNTGPIVIADCANVRPEDAELALFGDDLRQGTPGWLRLASGGTLFLDRATALGADVLRELDEAIATRSARSAVGRTPYAIDVRIVIGVQDDLAQLVERSSMDAGLAERVRALRVEVPPLRERPEDLGSLVLFAIDRACRGSGAAPLGIADDALAELAAHDWPGNELELFALIERAVRRASPPRITKADVGPLVVHESHDPLEGSLADIERRALEMALARAGGNKSEAARLLGIARTTFLDKLKRAGIDAPEDRRSTRPPAEPKRESVPPKSRKTSAA
jgi:DNA-binding NtrC family response regulator